VGAFVETIFDDINMSQIEGKDPRQKKLANLFIKDKSGNFSIFVDQAVYTRNR
jgi:hypothetical protein